MKNAQTTQEPEAATGQFAAVNKVSFGSRYSVSLRTVDGWLQAGCPHLKLSPRCVRIPVLEADQWVTQRYFTQRRAI